MFPLNPGADPNRRVDLRISRFEDFLYDVALTDPVTKLPLAGGIAGWTFALTVRTDYDNAEQLLAAIVINRDDVGCTFTFKIPVAQIRPLGSKLVSSVYDAIYIDNLGTQKLMAWGRACLPDGVTR